MQPSQKVTIILTLYLYIHRQIHFTRVKNIWHPSWNFWICQCV